MFRTLTSLAMALVAGSLACQQTIWQPLHPLTSGSPPVMVDDAARGRTVLVCGKDVFEWQRGRWAHRGNTPGLPYQSGAAAYDTLRQQTVVFGGRENSWSDATWEYGGRDFQLRQPAARPSARTTRLAHDPLRGRTVLFGGSADANWFDDTWEWDGGNWTMLMPALRPGARNDHALAWDPASGHVLLFGGGNVTGCLGDTWSWDGSQWVQLTPALAPSPRVGHALAGDPARGRVVLFGGSDFQAHLDDTWEWNGVTWTQGQPAIRPAPRSGAAMAFARALGRLLLFGGINPQATFVDTWSWDGAQWRLEADALPPGAAVSVATDRVRAQQFAFGVTRHGTMTNETWIGNGVEWTQVFPTQSPSTRRAPMACDEARQEMVLFGGHGSAPLGDTWVWNGSAWALRLPAVSPPAGVHVMAWDSARQVVVLCDLSGSQTEVWEWNGASWSLRPAAVRPSPRGGAAVGYDVRNHRLVLFGGVQCVANCSGTIDLADTWLWDGIAWSQASPALVPTARSAAMLVHDGTRQRLRLIGGMRTSQFGTTTVPATDAWEWDGATWSGPLTVPFMAVTGALFDPVLGRILVLATTGVSALTAAPADLQAYGAGCAGSRGMPWLWSNPPTVGNGSFALDAGALPSSAPCLVGLAASSGRTPVAPGCDLLLGPLVTILAAPANGSGFASIPVAIPPAPWLRGLVVNVQALALDPAVPAGLSLTPGLRLQVGD